MKHLKLYYALGMGVIFCTVVPFALTFWTVAQGTTKECNSLTVTIINHIGLAPSLVILTAFMIAAVFCLPLCFNTMIERTGKEWLEWILIGMMALALVIHALDTINDIAVIYNYYSISNATLAVFHVGNVLIKPGQC